MTDDSIWDPFTVELRSRLKEEEKYRSTASSERFKRIESVDTSRLSRQTSIFDVTFICFWRHITSPTWFYLQFRVPYVTWQWCHIDIICKSGNLYEEYMIRRIKAEAFVSKRGKVIKGSEVLDSNRLDRLGEWYYNMDLHTHNIRFGGDIRRITWHIGTNDYAPCSIWIRCPLNYVGQGQQVDSIVYKRKSYIVLKRYQWRSRVREKWVVHGAYKRSGPKVKRSDTYITDQVAWDRAVLALAKDAQRKW